MKKMITFLAAGALGIASAATHTITLYEDSTINGAELKAGDYRVNYEGGKAVLSQGKTKVESNVSVEDADAKYTATSVRYATADGKMRIREIRIGGTKTKLVFQVPDSAVAGAGGQR